MKDHVSRVMAVLTVLLIMTTGMVCLLSDDDSSAASVSCTVGTSVNKYIEEVYPDAGNDATWFSSVPSSSSAPGLSYKTVTSGSTKTLYLTGTPTKAGSYSDSYTVTGAMTGSHTSTVSITVKEKTVTYYSHTVYYNSNGGSGSMSSSSVSNTTSGYSSVTLKSNGFTAPSGYTFDCWKVGSSYYSAGSSVSVYGNSSVTAYAQWKQLSYTHTIVYNSNGGSGSMSNTVVTNTTSGTSSVTLASNSYTNSGYHFTGWKVNGTLYSVGTAISVSGNSSVTAYAQWEENTLSMNTVETQYAVVGNPISFTASATSDPSGASVTFSKSNVANGLDVSISGFTITCSATTAGTYTFTLTADATNYSSDSTTVTVKVVPVLAFVNTPSIGMIGS